MLRESAKAVPDKTLIHFMGQEFSYTQVDEMSGRVAASLEGLGLQRGDKVAVQLPNVPHFLFAYFGILKAGAVVVPLNVLLKRGEIAYHLADARAKAFFCFEGTSELPMGTEGWAAFNEVGSCERFFLLTADPQAASPIVG
ncbi:MAG TPA: AMP-binding protein, partial [Ilumatobacteraceae bacterium]|nr:AMP-binding protein [Ilumatobacteraceae bacterium]